MNAFLPQMAFTWLGTTHAMRNKMLTSSEQV